MISLLKAYWLIFALFCLASLSFVAGYWAATLTAIAMIKAATL